MKILGSSIPDVVCAEGVSCCLGPALLGAGHHGPAHHCHGSNLNRRSHCNFHHTLQGHSNSNIKYFPVPLFFITLLDYCTLQCTYSQCKVKSFTGERFFFVQEISSLIVYFACLENCTLNFTI